MDQRELDELITAYYDCFDESARLTSRSAQGVVEFVRVQELIAERIEDESRILDIGGGTGVHAAALAAAGHEVTLIDPVPSQVDKARAHGTFAARLGDARWLDVADFSFDVALLFGPLYHLTTAAGRQRCLAEAVRVVRGGGLVFGAVIPRLAYHAAASVDQPTSGSYPVELVELLESGTTLPDLRFPGGHFHMAAELVDEMAQAGLIEIEVHAVEGGSGLALEQIDADDSEAIAAAVLLARRTAHLPLAQELSNHLIGIGRVP